MRKITCIVCPVGCQIDITEDLKISGNQCKRGEAYAKQEMIDPRRMITTTLQTTSLSCPRLSVKTNQPLPKDKIFECLHILHSMIISNNVKIGDIIVSNILKTGVDIIATKDIRI